MWPLRVCTWTGGSYLTSPRLPWSSQEADVAQQQNEARLSRAASDALSTHWKRGQGKARPALGIPGWWAHVMTWPRMRGCTRGVPGGVMWTNSGVQGETQGGRTEWGLWIWPEGGRPGCLTPRPHLRPREEHAPPLPTHRWVSLGVLSVPGVCSGPSGQQAEPSGTSDSDTERMKTGPVSPTVSQGTAGSCLSAEHRSHRPLEAILVTDRSNGNSVVSAMFRCVPTIFPSWGKQLSYTPSLFVSFMEIFYDSLCQQMV